MAVPWDLLITAAGGITATVVGVVAGGLVGRRSQNRQWLQAAQTAAYEKFLQAFGDAEAAAESPPAGLQAPSVHPGKALAAT